MEEENKTIETINTDSEGNERCINAHYHCSNEESFVSKPKDGYGYVRTGVVEQVFLNGSSEGVASTLTTGHDRAKNITDPNGIAPTITTKSGNDGVKIIEDEEENTESE